MAANLMGAVFGDDGQRFTTAPKASLAEDLPRSRREADGPNGRGQLPAPFCALRAARRSSSTVTGWDYRAEGAARRIVWLARVATAPTALDAERAE